MQQIPTFDRILRINVLKIRLKRSGMYQIIPFRLHFEDSPAGKVPYLKCEKIIDMPELERIAQEYSFPIWAKNGKAFPKGTGAHDFAQKYAQATGQKAPGPAQQPISSSAGQQQSP